ncbi:protein phosphatase 1E [Pelomyxa schiedti]|nr:protein phosphatase 1E [Pelomyxa schiedti]
MRSCAISAHLCSAFARVHVTQAFETCLVDENTTYEYNFMPSAHCNVIEEIKVNVAEHSRFTSVGNDHSSRPYSIKIGHISRGERVEVHVIYLVFLKSHKLNTRKFTIPADVAPSVLLDHTASQSMERPQAVHLATPTENGLFVKLHISTDTKTNPPPPLPNVQCTSHEFVVQSHRTSSALICHGSQRTGLSRNMVFSVTDDLCSTNPHGWVEVFPTNPNLGDPEDPAASVRQTYLWSFIFQFCAPRATTQKRSCLIIAIDLLHTSSQVHQASLCKYLKSQLSQIPEHVAVNVIAYTPVLSCAFLAPENRSDVSVEQVGDFISQIRIPDKGGDLLEPLRTELSKYPTARQLLLITDTTTEEYLAPIFQLCGDLETRALAFLVGDEKPLLSCGLRYTMKSQGNYVYRINNSSKIHSFKHSLKDAFLRASDPVCVDAYLDWGPLVVNTIPKLLPPLFSSSVYTVVGYSSCHNSNRRPIVRLGCRSFSDNTDVWLSPLPFSGVTVLTANTLLKQPLSTNGSLHLNSAVKDISARIHSSSVPPVTNSIGRGPPMRTPNFAPPNSGRINRSLSGSNIPAMESSVSHSPVSPLQIHAIQSEHVSLGHLPHSHSMQMAHPQRTPPTSPNGTLPSDSLASVSSPTPLSQSAQSNSPRSIRSQALRMHKSVHALFELVPETFSYTLQMSLPEAYPMALHFAIQRIEELRGTTQLSTCDMELARACSDYVINGPRFNECLNKGATVEPHCTVNCVQVRDLVLAYIEKNGLKEPIKCPVVEAYGASKQGPRPSMEDCYILLPHINSLYDLKPGHPPEAFYAIFDGHRGHFAAQYSRINLHHQIYTDPSYYSDPQQAITNAYVKTDRTFNLYAPARKLTAGCTAVTAMLTGRNKLVVANVGDSEAVLCSAGKAVRLTTMHNPLLASEKVRVTDAGGCIVWYGTWRVNGILAVTRSIGDYQNEQVIADPAICERTLTPEDEFLVLGSDGLFDVLGHQVVVDIVKKLLQENVAPKDIPEKLVDAAMEAKTKDNTTVLIIFFNRTVNM